MNQTSKNKIIHAFHIENIRVNHQKVGLLAMFNYQIKHPISQLLISTSTTHMLMNKEQQCVIDIVVLL